MSTKIVSPALMLDERQRYSVEETLALLRTSRKSLYDMIRSGKVVPIKQGRRTFISGQTIARLSAAPSTTEVA
jgi:hypothetical protein